MIKEYILFVFISLSSFIYANQPEIDSTINLTTVKITANKVDDFSIGLKIHKLDSLTIRMNRFSSLGEIISRNTSIQIKQYSHNGMSSISFRGTAAHHTGIYWNGFQLNPSNTGQMDMSLIPVSFFNNISILHGGSSSLFGSGTIGGSIHLNSEASFRKSLSINSSMSIGSFGERSGLAGISFSNRKWYTNSTFTFKTALNNFEYQNLKTEKEKLKNANLQQSGFMQDIYRNINNNAILGMSFWYQHNDKKIPASLISKPSNAYQADESIRTMVSFRKFIRHGKYSFKTAFFTDYLNYVDPAGLDIISIDTKIKTNRSNSEFLYEKTMGENSELRTGVVFIYEKGMSNKYGDNKYRRQLGIFALYSRSFQKIDWHLNLNLRQDIVDGYNVPLTPALGFEGKIWRLIFGKISISRNFRVPSFNDLFWMDFGNAGLKPENSWNEEISLLIRPQRNDKQYQEIIFTLYNSNVDDWIQWVPYNGVSIPQNVHKVWARGVEFAGKSSFQIINLLSEINGGYTYAISTNEVKKSSIDQSYKKQLKYVPKHRFYINLSIRFNDFIINYDHTYTGKRYITNDNKDYLPYYSLGFFTFSKDFIINRHILGFQFDISNVWDVEYQTIKYFPMPGRYFKFTFNYKFHKKIKET